MRFSVATQVRKLCVGLVANVTTERLGGAVDMTMLL